MRPDTGIPKLNKDKITSLGQNPENNLFVMGIRGLATNGVSLEGAIEIVSSDIENAKSYDPNYLEQRTMLDLATQYLRSSK